MNQDQDDPKDRKLDPSAHFSDPGAVVAAADLSRTDKIEALTNWANEIRQLQVAEEENMRASSTGASLGERLREVEDALRQLNGDDAHHDSKS